MKTRTRRLAIILLAVAVTFTSMPFAGGFSYAASAKAKKPAKVTGVKATKAKTSSNVTITWTKVKKNKNTKGYAIYRKKSGEKTYRLIKKVGYKNNSYVCKGLKPGTYYFKVKAYNTYKEKQYYNTKTKKWQTKKPKKKYWKGKKARKKTKYVYGTDSAATKAVTIPKPATSNNVIPGDPGEKDPDKEDQETVKPGTKTVTDFLGVTRTIKKNVYDDGTFWEYTDDNGSLREFADSSMPRYDKTVDGEFTYQGWTYKQVSGAAFQIKGTNNSLYYSIETPRRDEANASYWFTAYNVDQGKLTLTPESGVSYDQVPSYYWPYLEEKASGTVDELTPVTKTYVIKNGKRIARLYSTPVEVKKDSIHYHFFTSTDGGTGVLYSDDFSVDVKYDGEYIGTLKIKKAEETTDNGMVPLRRLALDICLAAMDWAESDEGKAYYEGQAVPDKDIYRDFRYIKDYMAQNYTYDQNVTGYGTETGNLHCTMCAYILETWAVYKYDRDGLGFIAWGNSGSKLHVAYHLNNDPGYSYGEIKLPN